MFPIIFKPSAEGELGASRRGLVGTTVKHSYEGKQDKKEKTKQYLLISVIKKHKETS